MSLSLIALSLFACSTSDREAVQEIAFHSSGEVIEGQFVIGADLTREEADALAIQKLRYNPILQAGLYEAPRGVGVEKLEAALATHTGRGATTVEANRPVHQTAVVNDALRGYQWNFDMLQAEAIWDLSTGRGVTVAVVDTGVSTAGNDTPKNMLQGKDFVDNDLQPADLEGHGTHVAGTIAQHTGNGVGAAGLAYDANILPVRVLGPQGGSTYDVADGITWAVEQGADVINLSLGSSSYTSVMQNAIDYAVENGVIVVAATGNDGKASVNYPGANEGVIGVGAVGADQGVAPYSNGGTGLDLVAPGGNMEMDYDGNGYGDGILQEVDEAGEVYYAFYEGTSMATPHVAASAALLLAAGAAPEDVEGLLRATAKDLEGAGWSTWTGYGLIQPLAALQTLAGSVADPLPEEEVVTEEPAPVTDTTAPTLADITGDREGAALTLAWSSDERSSTEVEFEGFGRYGDAEDRTTAHEIRFTLDAASTYTFRVISVDDAGNEAVSGWFYTRP